MAKVVIAGFITRIKLDIDKNENQYIIVDLLQFGDDEYNSEIIPLRTYDIRIIDRIIKNYNDGDILELTSFCQVVKSQYKEPIWILREIVQIGGTVNVRQRNYNNESRRNDMGATNDSTEIRETNKYDGSNTGKLI